MKTPLGQKEFSKYYCVTKRNIWPPSLVLAFFYSLCLFRSYVTLLLKNHPSWISWSFMTKNTNSFCLFSTFFSPSPLSGRMHLNKNHLAIMNPLLSVTPPPPPPLSSHLCVIEGARNWPVYGCNYMFMSIFVSLLEGVSVCARACVCLQHWRQCVPACVRVWERKCVHCELWE